MTIKTLEYIHALLVDHEAATHMDYKAARKLQHEYEESETADEALVEEQKAAADLYMRAHSEAVNALRDFEQQKWR